MTFQLFNREFNINNDCRMWMSSAGGQWETQIGDANVGRVWLKDRFGLGAVGVNGLVLNPVVIEILCNNETVVKSND